MTAHRVRAPATALPQRTLALAAAETVRHVPGVAYLSPGTRGGGARHHDPAAGVTVTARAAGWHVRVHVALFAGRRAASVARDVRGALTEELSSRAAAFDHDGDGPADTPSARVTVTVVVTAVLPQPPL
ncbi:hypothetical protein LO772_32995 [Yinghuangia sp. ASG 101]|uniref:hypothetical protein n=1 Tax=Yinghuangia sp. ASG 101 TaxID=2896848 RepID=UPI001E437CBC|nr:hypothetical protein [Yinghuangia sp. ASG 101]UGQ11543.1 hypothetical protein LO772_32995 [Yinghuangia sp. ASG 101]